jgi:hypothetical protein
MLAFRALKQGLKSNYDNWRMWTNYTIVAIDVGELSEACRALSRVVEERASKVGAESVDADVLDRLVTAATSEENSNRRRAYAARRRSLRARAAPARILAAHIPRTRTAPRRTGQDPRGTRGVPRSVPRGRREPDGSGRDGRGALARGRAGGGGDLWCAG